MALEWNYGTMAAGKSTLALQVDYNYRLAGRSGVLFTRGDRAGAAVISSRMGFTSAAVEVTDALDLHAVVHAAIALGASYVIADEAQFYSPEQIDQLARIADQFDLDVHCYGIATDFRSCLFPGSKRLFEIADTVTRLPAPARCWCGEAALFNARLVDGAMVTEGAQVVLGDTEQSVAAAITYTVLCRRHYCAKQPHRPVVSDPSPILAVKD